VVDLLLAVIIHNININMLWHGGHTSADRQGDVLGVCGQAAEDAVQEERG
jgi:hypothetical protein